jgi:putative membrane protein
MIHSRYSRYKSSSLILRDHLALERTAMANERTLLAYVRTMVGIMAVGGSLLKLFTGWIYLVSGWLMIVLGLWILIIGFVRYTRNQGLLMEVLEEEREVDNQDWMHQLLSSALEKLHLARLRS